MAARNFTAALCGGVIAAGLLCSCATEQAAAPSPEAKTKPQQQTLYTIEDLCNWLKISEETLHLHRRQGLLKASIYVGRSPRFTDADVEDYLNKFNS